MKITDMIERAAELGREQCRIGLDHEQQRLSVVAWTAKAAALANLGVPELRALRRRIEETCPHAWREVLVGARGWVDSGQPEPAILNALGDGDRFPAAYVQRLALIRGRACDRRRFWLTLSDNGGALRLALPARLLANGAARSQSTGGAHVRHHWGVSTNPGILNAPRSRRTEAARGAGIVLKTVLDCRFSKCNGRNDL